MLNIFFIILHDLSVFKKLNRSNMDLFHLIPSSVKCVTSFHCFFLVLTEQNLVSSGVFTVAELYNYARSKYR